MPIFGRLCSVMFAYFPAPTPGNKHLLKVLTMNGNIYHQLVESFPLSTKRVREH